MTEKDLIKQLKSLKTLEPSQKWLSLTRQKLLLTMSEKVEVKPSMDFSEWFWFHKFQPMVLSLAMFMIVFGGPWLAIMASQSSMPGDILYSVKKITERIQTEIAGQNNKAQVQVDIAWRRLEELNKISLDSFSQEEKQTKTKEVINDFKGNLSNIEKNINQINKEKATVLAQKTEKLEKNLSQLKENAYLENQAEILEAEEIIKEIKNRILAVLAKEEENSNQATSSEEIIEEVIQDKNSNTETSTPKIIQ